jgi:hypothetical protein
MDSTLQIAWSGLTELKATIVDAQKLKVQFMRSEFKRGGNRVRREFIRRDLSGRPGIEGGPWRKGKHVFSYVVGRSQDDVGVMVGINKALRVHEEGHTFHPVKGQYLYLRSNKHGRGTGTIMARVKQVTIPKRTHFVDLTREMAPSIVQKAGEAGYRGVVVAAERHLKRFTGNL